MSQYGHRYKLRYDAEAPCDTVQGRCDTRSTARYTACSARAAWIESRYNFLYRDRGRRQQRCDTACHLACGRGNTAWHACDTATIRRSTCHDTAPSARYARAMGAQPRFRLCTLCTQPSLNSGHCSESLFGTLFIMRFSKKNKNKNF